MGNLKSLQKEVLANRIRRGWKSAYDLSKTTCGLAEEVGEFERARRNCNHDEMLNELADIAIWVIGAFEILNCDAYSKVEEVIVRNATRDDQTEI